ncbi:hypothetical protein F5Y18DRAFT_434472 [Xylariaceae sp. FL1019]|nr:hypothetical protein F5Y18DRAFT_434472 [Xylariaceae sp. FL1019]
MAQLSVRRWLNSALSNDKPFVYPEDQVRVTGSHELYTSLAASVKVQKWHELENLPALGHLGPEPDRPLHDDFATAKPVILDAFRVLAVEANLQHFLDHSLIYGVNIALRSIYRHPVTILPHIPFTHLTYDGPVNKTKSYTPDYTVFKGHVEQDPALLTDNDACLVVGDVKLYGAGVPKDPITNTSALRPSDLGQIVLMEFIMNRSDDIAALSDVVARAESELSSPIPLGGKRRNTGSTAGSTVSPSDRHQHKRRNTGSTAGSTVSPSDRHQHKRGGAATDAVERGASLASSPSLPSSIPEQSSPRTPELDSSDSYVPSTPGEISAKTLEDLSSAGEHVVVRLYSFQINKLTQWAAALYGFISLAQLVDTKGGKKISATPTEIVSA